MKKETKSFDECAETEKLERNLMYTLDFCKRTVFNWLHYSLTKEQIKVDLLHINRVQNDKELRNIHLIDSFVFEYLEKALAEYKGPTNENN